MRAIIIWYGPHLKESKILIIIVHNQFDLYTISRYLLQQSREGRFAERGEKQPDGVEIDAWDLWVGFEVGVVAVIANTNIIMMIMREILRRTAEGPFSEAWTQKVRVTLD